MIEKWKFSHLLFCWTLVLQVRRQHDYSWERRLLLAFDHIGWWYKELETLYCQIDLMPHVSFYTSASDAAFTGGKLQTWDHRKWKLGVLLREALHQGHLWLLHSPDITLLPWLIYSDTRSPNEGRQVANNHGVTESSIWRSGRVHLTRCWSCTNNSFNQVTSGRNQVLWKWETIY